MARKYSLVSFRRYQDELVASQYFWKVIHDCLVSDEKVYVLVGQPGSIIKERTVTYYHVSNEVKCEYRYFNFEGIPCRHLIFFYHYMFDGADFPESYTLSRWCKGARTGIVMIEGVEIKDHEDDKVVSHMVSMNWCTRKLVELVILDAFALQFAMRVVDMALTEVMRVVRKNVHDIAEA